MADTQILIPEELKEKHGELIEMILKTESMDDDERQYWVDLMPVMTDEQIKNLFDILDNERKKLAEIDEFYNRKADDIEAEEKAEQMIEQRKAKMSELENAEIKEEEEEKALEEQLLSELENL